MGTPHRLWGTDEGSTKLVDVPRAWESLDFSAPHASPDLNFSGTKPVTVPAQSSLERKGDRKRVHFHMGLGHPRGGGGRTPDG